MSSAGRDPCGFVIFGASGDLAARKLLPALFRLHRHGLLPAAFFVVGAGRTPLTSEQFRAAAKKAVGEALPERAPETVPPGVAPAGWEGFASRLFYHAGDPVDPASYPALRELLADLDRRFATGGNLFFHLALPPALHEAVAGALVASGLARLGPGSWPRIVVEKPFGSDLASSVSLDRALRAGFSEEQVYRIDHYLARETVQDVLLLRFANAVFEPLWNREHVERVEILATETIGMEGRGATYDRAGVVRDMFQSHLMQLLALVASEPPAGLEAGPVQDGKTRLLRCLRPFPADDIPGNLVFGQYAGYRGEAGVRPDSPIPTFARLRVFIDNPRWRGVPFFLTSGKKLREKRIEVTLFFRPSSLRLFPRAEEGGNSLTLGIHPREGVTLRFFAKQPGPELRLREGAMEFDYAQGFPGPFLEPYEKALLDVMAGDHLLFWRQDGVELSWGYLDAILEACERCVPSPALHPYAVGSEGPGEARQLV